jgi:hypothetical protein
MLIPSKRQFRCSHCYSEVCTWNLLAYFQFIHKRRAWFCGCIFIYFHFTIKDLWPLVHISGYPWEFVYLFLYYLHLIQEILCKEFVSSRRAVLLNISLCHKRLFDRFHLICESCAAIFMTIFTLSVGTPPELLTTATPWCQASLSPIDNLGSHIWLLAAQLHTFLPPSRF